LPVLETDFLKGMLDPKDRLHGPCQRALVKVKEGEWSVASSAFIELDLLLKNGGIDGDERSAIFETLSAEIPWEAVRSLAHTTLSRAAALQSTHRHVGHFYFDSIHLAVALEGDRRIVSTDHYFENIAGVTRIPLEKL